MINSFRLRYFALTLTAIIATTLGNHLTAAETKPFMVIGVGVILDDVPLVEGGTARHVAIGGATLLGLYYGGGVVRVDDPATGEFSSAVPFKFVSAARRDVLAFKYGRTDAESGASPPAEKPGSVMLEPTEDGKFIAIWLAEFNPVPAESTGRFQKVVAITS
jgi:hypothetical protein